MSPVRYARRASRAALIFMALCSMAPAHADAQAWVPAPGTGSASLDYQHTHVKNHLFSQDVTFLGGVGPALDAGKIDAETAQLGLDYGVMRNVAVTLNIAYVSARYRGNQPEAVTDDGKFHGSFQDLSLGVRYMIPWQGFAITPSAGYSAPTTNYEHHGHVAVGKANTSFTAGVAVGRSLTPLVPNVWMQGGYTHNFTKDIQQWGLDLNSFSGTIGWYAMPQFSVSGYFTYLATEDGIDWYWDDFSASDVAHNHDRAAKSVARRAGGTLSYQLDASKGFFLDVGGILSGANTHDGISYTVGTNWSFLGPKFGR